jgi:peroxiredoxin
MKRSIFSVAAVALMASLVGAFAMAGDKHDKHAEKHGKVAVGQAAPQFSLQDQDGKQVNLADYADKVVVLEWFNNDCPYVVKFYKNGDMNKWAEAYKAKGVVWLAVNSTKNTSNADNKKVSGDWNISRPVLNDATGEIGHLYGATNTPQMFVVNKGQIAYMGAIDDKRSSSSDDVAGAKNYVAKALDEILAGQSVSEPETKAYGCSVKYAK